MDPNLESERELLQTKRTGLVDSLTRIDAALAALDGNGGRVGRKAKGGKGDDPAPVRAGRKPMSPKAKKAARDRMLAYWAAKRAAAAKPKARPTR